MIQKIIAGSRFLSLGGGMFGLILTLVAFVGSASPVPRCDMVEINHYQPEGHVRFVQLIAWDWSPQFNRWNCQGYQIIEDWTRTADGVIATEHYGKRIELRCRLFRETFTEYDPELENQRVFPVRERRVIWR